jgi:predicted restriction endonuclease
MRVILQNLYIGNYDKKIDRRRLTMTITMLKINPNYSEEWQSLKDMNYKLEEFYEELNLKRWVKYRASADDTTFLDTRTRDPYRTKLLKRLYKHKCQLCGCRQEVSPGKYYSEVHHLQQINEDGPDIFENMIVVCKSCHLYLDKGSIRLNVDDQKIHHFDSSHELHRKTFKLRHYIDDTYLLAQNERYLCNM